MDFFQSYGHTVTALGGMALLMFLQLLVADVLGIRAKHLPGAAVAANHDDPLFRASRVVANCNESIVIFVLAVTYCLLNGASVEYTSYLAWGFVAARAGYALCYYLDIRMMRSIIFGLSLLMLAGLLGVGTFS